MSSISRWPLATCIHLLLVSFVGLGFCFGSTAALAANDLAASDLSLLETVVADRTVEPTIVYSRILDQALKPGTFFSLGESHLEPETVNPLSHKLARLFTDKVRNGFEFCSESIFDFLNSQQGLDVRRRARTTSVFKGNSPARTDFKNCKWTENTNALTYSGFFHQHPFGLSWPQDIPPSAVLTEPGNNIKDQLAPRSGLFVSQVELIWLQTLASKNIITRSAVDPQLFRSRAQALMQKIDQLKSKMSLLVGPKNKPLKNKYGAFLDKNSFDFEVGMDNSSYILVTNRGIHREYSQLGFLDKLLRKSDQDLSAFLAHMQSSKPFYVGGYTGPTEKGKRIVMQYEGLEFDGEGDILQIEDRVMISDFGKNDFICFQIDPNPKVAAKPIGCESFF